MGDVFALEPDLPAGGLDEPHDGAGEGGFAAAALAYEPDGFAGCEAEADAINGFHEFADRSEHPRLDGKVHL